MQANLQITRESVGDVYGDIHVVNVERRSGDHDVRRDRGVVENQLGRRVAAGTRRQGRGRDAAVRHSLGGSRRREDHGLIAPVGVGIRHWLVDRARADNGGEELQVHRLGRVRGVDRACGRVVCRQVAPAEDVAIDIRRVRRLGDHGHVRVGPSVRRIHPAQIIQDDYLRVGAIDLGPIKHNLPGVTRIKVRHTVQAARQHMQGATRENSHGGLRRWRGLVADEHEVGDAISVDITHAIRGFAESREVDDVVGLRRHQLQTQRRERSEEHVSPRAAIHHEVFAAVAVEVADAQRVRQLLAAVHAFHHERLVDVRVLVGACRVGNVNALEVGRGRRRQRRRGQVEAMQPLQQRRGLAGGIEERNERQAVEDAQG